MQPNGKLHVLIRSPTFSAILTAASAYLEQISDTSSGRAKKKDSNDIMTLLPSE